MGQENEQEAELIATIQHDHSAMKKWYNTHSDAKILHNLYGPTYPDFWRDVVHWKGWKETRKRYLKSIDGHLDSRRREEAAKKAAAAAAAAGTSTSASPRARASGSSNGDAVPRKRKSRWATASNNNNNGNNSNHHTSSPDPDPPKRKSRWARGRDPTPKSTTHNTHSSTNSTNSNNNVLDLLPGLPTALSSAQSTHLTSLQKTLRECNAKLSNLDASAAAIDALPIGHPSRSPSPPPIYGPDGKRKNTRAVRWRERYTLLRQDTLESILKLTSSATGRDHLAQSVAPSLFARKRTRKIYIPVEEHPTYNFIGLIIGPRGKTQKEMENQTGCKIAIRGKGSVKEGARGRRDGKVMEGDHEPLHVVVTGENQASVDAAAKMIEDMLVVIDDDKNVHKQAQLRELALLNGTLKEDEYCSICAEKGHRAFECPKRFSGAGLNKGGRLEVKCAICGDTSHPTRDCKQTPAANGVVDGDGVVNGAGGGAAAGLGGGGGANGAEKKDAQQLDSDYLAFMNELDGKPADHKAVEPKGPSIASLVTSIGADGKVIGGAPMCLAVPDSVKKPMADGLGAGSGSGSGAGTGAGANGSSSLGVGVKPSSGGSLITTISSRVVKSTEVAASAGLVTSITGATAAAATASAPLLPSAPSASMSMPPPPTTTTTTTMTTMTGATLTAAPTTATSSSTISSAAIPNTALPPPPPGPPPPVPHQTSPPQQQQSYSTQQYQYPHQQPPYGYGGGYSQQPPQQHQQHHHGGYPPQGGVGGGQGYPQGGYAGHHQQQQQYGGYGQGRGHGQHQGSGAGAGAGGWDYRSFYGNGNQDSSGDGGAGGMNWWDSSDS